jgi:hypothetical protein
MKGYPVLVVKAACKSVMQKQKVMTITKPRTPLRITVDIMTRGTVFDASRTSSAVVSVNMKLVHG